LKDDIFICSKKETQKKNLEYLVVFNISTTLITNSPKKIDFQSHRFPDHEVLNYFYYRDWTWL